MVKNKNVLSAQQIANFYDRFGKRQEQQAFYEDIAISELDDLAEQREGEIAMPYYENLKKTTRRN